jgi:integrase
VTAVVLAPVGPGRVERDRLELLAALIEGPSFDPMFRGELIRIPPDHPVYPWQCAVADCERPRWGKSDLCVTHQAQWRDAQREGVRRSVFVCSAQPLRLNESLEPIACRVCHHRPAFNRELELCHRHRNRWRDHKRRHGPGADLERWLARQVPYDSYGDCCAGQCCELAGSPLGLCVLHDHRYIRAGRPGGARLPRGWFGSYEYHGEPVPVSYADRAAFRRWCAKQVPLTRIGVIDLRGLRPLVRAEIQWALHAHARGENRVTWHLRWIQSLVEHCHREKLCSLLDADPGRCSNDYLRRALQEIVRELELVYATPADTKEAGYIETEHFGVRFPDRCSRFDFTGVAQQWLRDLLWDCAAQRLRSPQCPRTAHFLDLLRKACLELGTFLTLHAPDGGHDPRVLSAQHMERFVTEYRRRERLGLPTLALTGRGKRKKAIVAPALRHTLFNAGRQVLRGALETGEADRIGLDRGFIAALPPGGPIRARTRSPFPDEVAKALTDEANLAELAAAHDAHDRGLRDMWEIIVATGRRVGEVTALRLECVGRYNGLPLLWHDQTKVGRYDEAIRIPETVYERITARQRTTLGWFADRHGGRQATAQERAAMALFPTNMRNPDGRASMSSSWFSDRFRAWVDGLDLGHYVAHQARHTLATRLLKHGATLTHIRRYLGHVSDRMAEHYTKVAVSEIEDILQRVWVAGPGAPHPGELLSDTTTPMTRLEAEALALDLSRRSTPAEGGFCTFQPVVDGGACPWQLNCEGCDKFVLSGADLLYWRRKREQWRSIAERAPDDATADYLHQVFEPTATAIDGLEKALAGLGLLEDALALDLRRPQDYFQRVWSIGFRASDLARTTDPGPADESELAWNDGEPA